MSTLFWEEENPRICSNADTAFIVAASIQTTGTWSGARIKGGGGDEVLGDGGLRLGDGD